MRKILFYLDNKVLKTCNDKNCFCKMLSYEDIPAVGKQVLIGERIYLVKDISVGKSVYVSLKVDMNNLGKIRNHGKDEKKRLYYD